MLADLAPVTGLGHVPRGLLRFLVSAAALLCLVVVLTGGGVCCDSPDGATFAQQLVELDDMPSVTDSGDDVAFLVANLPAGPEAVHATPTLGSVRFSSRFPAPQLRPPRNA